MRGIRTRRGWVRGPRISSDAPLWRKLLVVGIIAALLGWVIWLAFDFGRYRAGFDSNIVGERSAVLRDRVEELDDENKELRQRLAVIERGEQIDVKAAAESRKQFKELQDERMRLEKEVSFLRSVVSPDQTEQGLQVQDFKLVSGAGGDEYRFQFTLTRSKKGKKAVKGDVAVSLSGVQDGQILHMALSDVTADKKDKIKFQFKNFQTLKGIVRLPDGFAPDSLILDIHPKSRGFDKFVRSFDWIVKS